MLRFRRTALAALAASALMVATVGSGANASTSSSATAAKKPTKGGSLTFLHSREVPSLDVTSSTGATNVQIGDSHQFQAIYDVLAYEDASGKVVPRLLQSITPNADASVWTLKVRPNVKFGDGTTLDAAAVKFNWDRLADPANRALSQAAFAAIASTEVVDASTLKVTLKTPYGQFPRQIARSFPFVGSPTAIQTKGAGFATAPVGAGPFIVKEWVRNSTLTLTRNPNYWDAPKPYLDELIIKQVLDGEQRYNTFRSGGADIMGVGSEYQFQVRAVQDKLRYVVDVAPYGGAYFSFNMRRAPFNDVLARKAFSEALNVQGMIDTLYPVVGYPKTLFPKSSPFYANTKLIGYDRKAAQKDLDAYAAKYGKPLTVTMTALTSQLPELQYFQTQLASFKNLVVQIEGDVAANFVARLTTGQYDVMTAAISGYDPEPDYYNHYKTGGLRNYMGYSDPEMDAALEKGRVSTDPKVRKAAYKTVQNLVKRDMPEVYWRQQMASFLLGKSVRGAELTPCCFLWGDVWKTK